MQIISQNFKEGRVVLRVTQLEDLWYLSQLVDPTDVLKGKTTRKIRIGDSENAKVTRKIMHLAIKAETIHLENEGQVLRVNGKVQEGSDDVPVDSYHSLNIQEGSEITLIKEKWLAHAKEQLQEAVKEQSTYLFAVFDREEALFATTSARGFKVIGELKGEVAKKRMEQQNVKDFFGEIIAQLQQYLSRFTPECIILASPAFYKDMLLDRLPQDLKKICVGVTCSQVHPSVLPEILGRPEVIASLQSSRVHIENKYVEEVLNAINKNSKVSYGIQSVTQAVEAGAVERVLLTSYFIQQKKESQEFLVVDNLLKKIDSMQGHVTIISSEHAAGKKLDGLGGIAALLRFKLEW